MGREWIAVTTGTPLADVAVEVMTITVPGMGNILRSADEINHTREYAAQMMQKAQDLAVSFARELAAAGIPVRDSAELLGVSPQRISQLSTVQRDYALGE
ncbi:Uncharacterised protein [Mycobacterium tuberculosis]|nr:Uncharacterised protein [Mycobacterium tuberculosis]